ncbi:hypothetical protein EXT48_23480, partial [Pseudoalteromonas sp. CO348]
MNLFINDAGILKAQAPKGAVTESIARLIKENKESLISYLVQLSEINLQGNNSETKISVIHRSKEQTTYPVSFSQQRLWFIDKLQGGTPEYNMPMVFRVTGTFSLKVLTQVFET